MTTNVSQVIGELDGGQFEGQLSTVLSEVAAAVMDNDGKGKASITLDIKRIANSSQVTVLHTIKYSRPTKVGTRSEDIARSTPMYVGTKGSLSYFPENQAKMFDLKGNFESS